MSLPVLQPPVITLTTDFGLSDVYVGIMKGVILSISPQARLIDLTHDITPQDILEGSVRLEAAVDYFPLGTVHLAVVDPGVGSARAVCVVETERALYVAPDNGLLTLPLRRQPLVRMVHPAEAAQSLYLKPVSSTFHGRDLFAPLAAHLANGLPLDALGNVRGSHDANRVLLDVPMPQAVRYQDGRRVLLLNVIYADRFGNLITNMTPDLWDAWRRETMPDTKRDEFEANAIVQAGNREWRGLSRTFSDVAEGEPLAYWGSGGRLAIGVRNGSAAQRLSLLAGSEIKIESGIGREAISDARIL